MQLGGGAQQGWEKGDSWDWERRGNMDCMHGQWQTHGGLVRMRVLVTVCQAISGLPSFD